MEAQGGALPDSRCLADRQDRYTILSIDEDSHGSPSRLRRCQDIVIVFINNINPEPIRVATLAQVTLHRHTQSQRLRRGGVIVGFETVRDAGGRQYGACFKCIVGWPWLRLVVRVQGAQAEGV